MPIQTEGGVPSYFNLSGGNTAVVIPEYDEIDIEIIKNNMRTVGMSREQYLDLLSKV